MRPWPRAHSCCSRQLPAHVACVCTLPACPPACVLFLWPASLVPFLQPRATPNRAICLAAGWAPTSLCTASPSSSQAPQVGARAGSCHTHVLGGRSLVGARLATGVWARTACRLASPVQPPCRHPGLPLVCRHHRGGGVRCRRQLYQQVGWAADCLEQCSRQRCCRQLAAAAVTGLL